MSWKGSLLSIQLTQKSGEPLTYVDSVEVTESGLKGDRYEQEVGTFSKKKKKAVTLIEKEALEALEKDYGFKVEAAETRRNLLTENVPLNHLVGHTFQIGEVVFEGMELCEPCGYLEEKTGKKIRAGLVHRGGLRARILKPGTLHKGDEIQPAQTNS